VRRVVTIREDMVEIRPRIERATTFGWPMEIAFLEFAAATEQAKSLSPPRC